MTWAECCGEFLNLQSSYFFFLPWFLCYLKRPKMLCRAIIIPFIMHQLKHTLYSLLATPTLHQGYSGLIEKCKYCAGKWEAIDVWVAEATSEKGKSERAVDDDPIIMVGSSCWDLLAHLCQSKVNPGSAINEKADQCLYKVKNLCVCYRRQNKMQTALRLCCLSLQPFKRLKERCLRKWFLIVSNVSRRAQQQ